MKKKCLILILLAVNLIVIGFLVQKINNKLALKEEKDNIKYIEKYNKKFEEKIQVISGERSIYINDISNNLKEENIIESYDKWIEVLNTYKREIDSLKEDEESIKKYCVDFKYKDTKTNSDCQSIIFKYETAINYFVKDIESFNNLIEQNNLKDDTLKKEKYNGEYEYIDINNDGKHIGK